MGPSEKEKRVWKKLEDRPREPHTGPNIRNIIIIVMIKCSDPAEYTIGEKKSFDIQAKPISL